MHIKKEIYLKRITPKLNKKMIVKNICLAFLFGGIICLIGQAIITIFKHNGVDDELSSTYMIGIMILAAGVSSAFGFYDRLGQIGKCGFSIPITGEASRSVTHPFISKDIKKISNQEEKGVKTTKKSKIQPLFIKNEYQVLKKRVFKDKPFESYLFTKFEDLLPKKVECTICTCIYDIIYLEGDIIEKIHY